MFTVAEFKTLLEPAKRLAGLKFKIQLQKIAEFIMKVELALNIGRV
jgi:hypothetical protein